jgi:WD40 repeat protein
MTSRPIRLPSNRFHPFEKGGQPIQNKIACACHVGGSPANRPPCWFAGSLKSLFTSGKVLVSPPDATKGAAISEDGVVKLYDLRLEKQITQWNAHTNTIREKPDYYHHAIVFTPDGSTIITAGRDAAVRFWHLGTNVALVHESMGLGDEVVRLAISPDGSTLAGQCFSEIVYLWRLRPGAAIGPVEIKCPDDALPGGIAFSPDGGKLLVGGGTNRSFNTICPYQTGHASCLIRILSLPSPRMADGLFAWARTGTLSGAGVGRRCRHSLRSSSRAGA